MARYLRCSGVAGQPLAAIRPRRHGPAPPNSAGPRRSRPRKTQFTQWQNSLVDEVKGRRTRREQMAGAAGSRCTGALA